MYICFKMFQLEENVNDCSYSNWQIEIFGSTPVSVTFLFALQAGKIFINFIKYNTVYKENLFILEYIWLEKLWINKSTISKIYLPPFLILPYFLPKLVKLNVTWFYFNIVYFYLRFLSQSLQSISNKFEVLPKDLHNMDLQFCEKFKNNFL